MVAVGTDSAEPRGSVLGPGPIDLDYVLTNELGQLGRFQIKVILLVFYPIVTIVAVNEYIFTAAAIPHRCQIPECGEITKSTMYEHDWLSNAIPETGSGIVSCQRFQPIGAQNGTLDYCPITLFDQENTIQCDGYIYARDNSVVYDFDLGCAEWLRALAGTFASVGTLIALPIVGYISDRFGRRFAFALSIFNLAFFGFIKAFSINYPMYLAMQLLQASLGSGTFSSVYILVMELVGPKYRVLVNSVCVSISTVGQVILGCLAWWLHSWRHLTLAVHTPIFLGVFIYWFLPESVRWMLSKQKYDGARATLEEIARVNKKEISETSIKALLTPPARVHNTGNKQNQTLLKTIFKSKVLLRRVCTTPIWWITTTFVYLGLSINSTSLSDTIYLNFILVSAIEVPGFFSAVLFLDRIGRRITLSGGFFFSAMCNIAFVIIPNDQTMARLVIYLMGKFGISMVFGVLYLYTSELYPTQYRHSLLAFSSMIGRIGSIAAPLTPVLMQYWAGIPSVMFGAMGFLSGVLVLTQPETLGTRLPDTLADAEAIGRLESKIKLDA